jgi:hypothetical protein
MTITLLYILRSFTAHLEVDDVNAVGWRVVYEENGFILQSAIADALKLQGLGTTCVQEVQRALWSQFNINWK